MHSILCLLLLAFATAAHAEERTLLNVSYDPTRELYADYNRYFKSYWKEKTGETVRIRMSHGGSGKQARAVLDGLKADVVTLALGYDIDALAKAGLVAEDWRGAFPQRAAPYRSLVVFLVRKGNPKGIHDWDDLTKDGVSVLTPNPKTSGGARWNYLAAWAYAQQKFPQAKAEAFMRNWLGRVKIFDTGARGSTTNFVRRRQGDVLITWENEAHVAQHYFGEDTFEIVIPSVTILAEPPVAVVRTTAEARGTAALAKSYLEGLYSEQGQRLAAKHYFRPALGRDDLPPLAGIRTVTIEQLGGWDNMQREHFADGGLFDKLTARE